MAQKNVVLVHGAWADGSSWSNVIRRLPEKNLNVTAAQIPLTSLADDISVTRNLLNAQKGPKEVADLIMLAVESLGKSAKPTHAPA